MVCSRQHELFVIKSKIIKNYMSKASCGFSITNSSRDVESMRSLIKRFQKHWLSEVYTTLIMSFAHTLETSGIQIDTIQYTTEILNKRFLQSWTKYFGKIKHWHQMTFDVNLLFIISVLFLYGFFWMKASDYREKRILASVFKNFTTIFAWGCID